MNHKIHAGLTVANFAEPIWHHGVWFSCEKNMSEEEKQTEDVEAFKAKIAELEAQLKSKDERIEELEAEDERLKATLTEATKTLTAYVEREKETAITAILEKANLCEDELKKLGLAQLKLVQKSIDSVKGTVKNVRSAAADNTEDNRLTVGCLYHKKEQ